jgi:RNA polymerase sigma-70 factor (ECF subfamily)
MTSETRKTILDTLVENYDEMLRFVARGLGGWNDAPDVIQDTVVKLQKIPDGVDVQNPRAYLYRMITNQVVDHMRRQSSTGQYISNETAPDKADNEPSQEDVVYSRQRLKRLEEAVLNLSPRQKMVFIMHKFDGLTYGEIAEELGISKSAVEKLMMKALASCRGQLDDLHN